MLRIGEKFRAMHDGDIFKAILVYNSFDEDYPYIVVNLSNYEVIDGYCSIDKIPVHDIILTFNKFLIDNEKPANKEKLRYRYADNIFKVYRESNSIILDEEVTSEEALKLESLCLIYDVKKLN